MVGRGVYRETALEWNPSSRVFRKGTFRNLQLLAHTRGLRGRAGGGGGRRRRRRHMPSVRAAAAAAGAGSALSRGACGMPPS